MNPVKLTNDSSHGWHWRQILPSGKMSSSFVPLSWEHIPANASPEDLATALRLLGEQDDKPF